jgi:hypothetical protein
MDFILMVFAVILYKSGWRSILVHIYSGKKNEVILAGEVFFHNKFHFSD